MLVVEVVEVVVLVEEEDEVVEVVADLVLEDEVLLEEEDEVFVADDELDVLEPGVEEDELVDEAAECELFFDWLELSVRDELLLILDEGWPLELLVPDGGDCCEMTNAASVEMTNRLPTIAARITLETNL